MTRRTVRISGLLAMACLSAALLAACGNPPINGNLRVSTIGTGFKERADPNRGSLAPADRVLIAATHTGLVGFDALGQVEPGLGESWITAEDGTSTIFRIRRVDWPGGAEATGDEVAASLDLALAPTSKNALKPLLSSVEAFVGMTGRVVEVRLRVARPNLLQLLAQPEFGIRRGVAGLGPYRIAQRSAALVQLVAIGDGDDTTVPYDPVTLRSERAARAVARFTSGGSDYVGGGTLADLPIVQVARPAPGRLRFDPVDGLFGLAIVGRTPFLAEPGVRRALAMAIDRPALAATVGLPIWAVREAMLPAPLDSARAVARPGWSDADMAARRSQALASIAIARRRVPDTTALRVALPSGPGMRTMFAQIAADWRAIGVVAVAVSHDSPADLRLIDAVSPNASANWYLTTLSCAAGLVCDSQGDKALMASRAATTLDARSAAIADADAALAARASFIPLGAPVRWSLVGPRLTGWRENALGVHPLHRLRTTPVGQP